MMSNSRVHSQSFAERAWRCAPAGGPPRGTSGEGDPGGPRGGGGRACGPNGGNCVEVNLGVPGLVGVRDSKSSSPELLIFESAGWGVFADALRRGRYDVD